MADAKSNIGEVADYFNRVMSALDMTRSTTAEALAAPIRKGIADRAAARSGPDGAWADNVGRYKTEKDKLGLLVGTGIGDDEPKMLDADQLHGEIKDVETKKISIAYGVDEEVKKRGQWFHNGGAEAEDGTQSAANSNQISRPFWEATQEDLKAVGEVARSIIQNEC